MRSEAGLDVNSWLGRSGAQRGLLIGPKWPYRFFPARCDAVRIAVGAQRVTFPAFVHTIACGLVI